MSDDIRAAIQRLLDEEGEGWTVGPYVVAMGLERVFDGRIESTSWAYGPEDQQAWVTTGLLVDADRINISEEQ